MRQRSSSKSSSSSSDPRQFKRIYEKIYEKQKQKQQDLEKKNKLKSLQKKSKDIIIDQDEAFPKQPKQEYIEPKAIARRRSRSRDKQKQLPLEIRWKIYQRCPEISLKERIPHNILQLPIFRKKEEILISITQNQVLLITGETGCGKSTQVPRLIYEYLRNLGKEDKILCVQPRRLAVLNLHSILEKQMVEKGQIGYQIGMQSHIHPNNKIVFMTNGIFLQRLVHSTQFFKEYPFIILDEVHERDIDTDFILLSIKRILRLHPHLRIILMSATIDNQLFRYYFANDHIDQILLEKENFYQRIISAQMTLKQQHQGANNNEKDVEEDYYREDSSDEQKIFDKFGYEFMKAKQPCPMINVTQTGKFKREYFYLDTLEKFLKPGIINIKWGSIIFSEKYPNTHRELYETVNLIIDQVINRNRSERLNSSILIFLPGLGEIEGLSEAICRFFTSERVKKEFDLIHVHSSILNQEITEKLHTPATSKLKIILSTNIAESSITVLGVKYIIDFCLSKEIRFDLKSKMENLELVWASKASCDQRAGRTGRVCDGIIFRLMEESFHRKLPQYSTPEIQRSSLDKLILRIKMLHETQNNGIFRDPGDVLGSAIQPPKLKNIDTSIKSLVFCGGLQFDQLTNDFKLTNLGRLYIDIPIDITYCKTLIVSMLLGTQQDIIILVAILSQSKNAFRRGHIEKFYMEYYELMQNQQFCDFYALVEIYKNKLKEQYSSYPSKRNQRLEFEIFYQVKQLIKDIEKRLNKKNIQQFFSQIPSDAISKYDDLAKKHFKNQKEEYIFRFKITIICGFIENLLKVRTPAYDQKQDKRLKFMKKCGISNKNTICLLSSAIIKKPENGYNFDAEEKLKKLWAGHISNGMKISNINFTLGHGLSYLHFQNEKDLNKFLFIKYVEQNKKQYGDGKYLENNNSNKNYLSIADVLRCFGQMDHMQVGRPVTFCKEQYVTIDNYSLNRVINFNEDTPPKFLVCNNIAKQSSRMVTRYTSLLPSNIQHLDVISHLLFYPFVSLVMNKKQSRYEFIQIKRRHRIKITYELTKQEIDQANVIRRKFRKFYQMNTTNPTYYSDIDFLILQYMFLFRKSALDEERWQDIFLQELFSKNQHIKLELEAILTEIQNHRSIEIQNASALEGKAYMDDIIASPLKKSYFSEDLMIAGMASEARIYQYNEWKLQKLQEIKDIEDQATNHDAYLACGEDSCGVKLCKLKKIGPVTQEIYRELFEIVEKNVQLMPFNQMDSYFCTMMMGNYIDKEYKTYGCLNGHYFAIIIEGEKKMKILPFSQLMIIYADGTPEKADFDRLDMNHWRRKSEEKQKQKFKMEISTYCFVCNESFFKVKDLENHIKDPMHIENLSEFKKTMPDLSAKKEKMEEEFY